MLAFILPQIDLEGDGPSYYPNTTLICADIGTLKEHSEEFVQVIASSFTVADYCEQMRGNGIVVNHDYQRTDKVWPPAARSYLIETMLLGYPIPRESLHKFCVLSLMD